MVTENCLNYGNVNKYLNQNENDHFISVTQQLIINKWNQLLLVWAELRNNIASGTSDGDLDSKTEWTNCVLMVNSLKNPKIFPEYSRNGTSGKYSGNIFSTFYSRCLNITIMKVWYIEYLLFLSSWVNKRWHQYGVIIVLFVTYVPAILRLIGYLLVVFDSLIDAIDAMKDVLHFGNKSREKLLADAKSHEDFLINNAWKGHEDISINDAWYPICDALIL